MLHFAPLSFFLSFHFFLFFIHSFLFFSTVFFFFWVIYTMLSVLGLQTGLFSVVGQGHIHLIAIISHMCLYICANPISITLTLMCITNSVCAYTLTVPLICVLCVAAMCTSGSCSSWWCGTAEVL